MRIVVLALAAALATPAAAQTVPVEEVLRNAVIEVVRPGFGAFSTSAAALHQAMQALCDGVPTADELAASRQAFSAAALAYGRVEAIRIGPLVEDNRAERLLFWPDPRGIGLRQVQQLLAERDETATEAVSLRDKSVAVQGFGALEFVLFGTGSETLPSAEGEFRCRYGTAIAGAIAVVAAELDGAWRADDGIAGRLMAPDRSYADYRTPTEALEELAGIVAHGMEAIRDTRLVAFLGRAGEEPRPRSALFWRSGLTAPMVVANFDGLRALIEKSGISQAPRSTYVRDAMRFEYRRVDRAAALVDRPVEEALTDPRQKQALDDLVMLTRALQKLAGEYLSAALGLSVGFSSLDGD